MAPPTKTPADSTRRLMNNIISVFKSNKDWIENPSTRKTKRELQRRIAGLEEQYGKFLELNNNLLLEDAEETDECLLSTQDLYFSVISAMETELDELEDNESDDDYRSTKGSSTGCKQPTVKIKLPELALPVFTGKTEEWRSFFERFQNAVRGKSVSDIERLQYLLHSVKGTAAQIIENLPIVKENYIEAVRLLKRRYENRRLNLRLHLSTLFNLSMVTENNENSLRELVDATLSTIRAIENLKYKREELSNALIVQLVLTKLDTKSRELWESSLDDTKAEEENHDSYEQLITFLENRLRVISTVFHYTASSSASASPKPRTTKPKTTLVTQTSDSGNTHSTKPQATPARTCPCCPKEHALYLCDVFKGLSISDRYNKVRDAKLCVNCFSNSHWSKVCKSIKCKTCGKPHHTLLHSGAPAAANTPAETTIAPVSPAQSTPSPSSTVAPTPPATILATVATSRRDALIATAIVQTASSTRECEAHILLDGASHITTITFDLAQRLGLELQHSTTSISGFQCKRSASVANAMVRLTSRDGNYTQMLYATVVNRITEPLPAVDFEIPSTWGLSSYYLANPQFNRSREIDMLIGADYCYDMFLPEMVKRPSTPVLLASRLGWLVAGPYHASNISPYSHCLKVTVSPNELQEISDFLGLEKDPEFGSESRSADELICEELFAKTHRRDETGRFVVRLPRRNELKLGESRHLAKARLKPVTGPYLTFLQEYERLGYMTRCAPPCPGQETYYLPHHAVYHNGKIRVVFDATMQSDNGLSLNDVLIVGAVVQPTSFTIFIRFRSKKYAFTCDITQMFQQILVSVQDRDLQRILMYIDGQLVDFQLNTITPGENCAPFEATRSLIQLANDGKEEYPAAAEVLEEETYMDDCLSGAHTVKEAKQRKDELVALLRTAGMKFSPEKWKSNHPDLLDTQEGVVQQRSGRTLGVEWDTVEDVFKFPSLATLKKEGTLTRRSALSLLARIFDPVCLLAPLTITGKLLIQQLWTEQRMWDDPVDPSFQAKFDRFLGNAAAVADVKFDRYLGTGGSAEVQIHGFGDASEQAYAACVYIRSIDNGVITTQLVAAKTRVAPRAQPRTIPQLELCAADLLVELILNLAKILRFPLSSCYTYTDSTIVMSYLAREPGHWKPYVANRVKRIISAIPYEQWRHVPGDQNPADLATRDESFSAFILNPELWLHGPAFLREVDTIPKHSNNLFDQNALCDAKVSLVTTAVIDGSDTPASSNPDLVNSIIARYSEFSKARSVIVSFLRVKAYLHAKIKSTPLPTGEFTSSEYMKAEWQMVRSAQLIAYPDEISALLLGKALPKKSMLKSLSPFLKDGLLRVGGRIDRADLSYDRRHPIILPANHRLTLLLIRDCHYRYMHAGPRFIDTHIRRRYRVIGSILPKIQKCVRTCARCVRFQRNAQRNPPMADLPAARVRQAYPFAEVGVDYAGPLTRKPDIRTRATTDLKIYVAVFCCFTTRAVHLEPVSDLTTDAFLAALRRFVGRRGLPQTVYSDNGTNFVGADNVLKKFATEQGISWEFNPPAAPHMGGLWEAAVRVMKFHLLRTLGDARLTFEEYSTILCQIEAIMNSRPIAPLNVTQPDPDCLTAGHFLIGRPLVEVPDDRDDVITPRLSTHQRWTLISRLRNVFWRRWSSEYLDLLQKRVKWTDPARTYRVNDIVFLHEASSPLNWPLGRITKVYPGADGQVRVVDLYTRGGSTLRRPVHKLIPFIDEGDDEVSTALPSTAAGC